MASDCRPGLWQRVNQALADAAGKNASLVLLADDCECLLSVRYSVSTWRTTAGTPVTLKAVATAMRTCGEARGSHRRFTPQLAPERQRELLFTVGLASGAFFRLVLSREWGNGLWGLLVGDYIGTTIGIHSSIPYLAPGSHKSDLFFGRASVMDRFYIPRGPYTLLLWN